MYKNIKPGYLLCINSWENDADNYKTERIEGLTYEDVQFYIYFCRHFYSSSWGHPNAIGKGFGNMDIEEAPDAESIAIIAAYEKYPPTSEFLLADVKSSIEGYKNCPEESYDWVDDLIGIWNEGETYRVFSGFEVHYISEEIPNVTTKFSEQMIENIQGNHSDV